MTSDIHDIFYIIQERMRKLTEEETERKAERLRRTTEIREEKKERKQK